MQIYGYDAAEKTYQKQYTNVKTLNLCKYCLQALRFIGIQTSMAIHALSINVTPFCANTIKKGNNP